MFGKQWHAATPVTPTVSAGSTAMDEDCRKHRAGFDEMGPDVACSQVLALRALFEYGIADGCVFHVLVPLRLARYTS
jgi:hypothetical protein